MRLNSSVWQPRPNANEVQPRYVFMRISSAFSGAQNAAMLAAPEGADHVDANTGTPRVGRIRTGEQGRDPLRPQFTDHCFTGDYPTALTDCADTGPRQLSLLAEAS